MKRFMTVLLVLSLFKVGAAGAATPTSTTNNNSKILFGNTSSKSTGLNQVLALLVVLADTLITKSVYVCGMLEKVTELSPPAPTV